MKKIAILGSTGSIGRSALSLVDLHPDWFDVVALVANNQTELLHQQCLRYRPSVVALFDEASARELAGRLPTTKVLGGAAGVVEAACDDQVETVLSAISGAAGLVPTYEAVRHGKNIALANKETLVMAGELLDPLVLEHGVTLLPVDSEHSALHQCLRGACSGEVRQLVLTASGGPFLHLSQEELEHVTPQQALEHPTWDMGPKISVDSATLMNKGLEVIEARHLFPTFSSEIKVVVHPQSIIHSLVEFVDGTLLAQLGPADMRTAILYALSYPGRREAQLPRLDLASLPSLEFHEPDMERFPCLRLAYQALESGQTYPTALNAANEVAVGLFLEEKLPFLSVPQTIESVLEQHVPIAAASLEAVLEADQTARHQARTMARQLI